MLDTPERSRKLGEHAAACDNMSRLITAIKAAGYTVTLPDPMDGFVRPAVTRLRTIHFLHLSRILQALILSLLRHLTHPGYLYTLNK
jgi:hypothetical protein